MATTAHQTWVRRAGVYFTDAAPGFTHRVRPDRSLLAGQDWLVERLPNGSFNAWEYIGSYPSAAKAKAAALADR